MASVTKRGDGYAIRVLIGVDSNGKRSNANMTWKPDRKMSEKKALEEAYRIAAEFEEQVKKGSYFDQKMTLERYVKEIWMSKAYRELESTTYNRYCKLLKRILPAMGMMKLTQIQPPKIRAFLDDLEEEKREDIKYYPKAKAIALAAGCNKCQFSKKAGISATTILAISRGNSVSEKSARLFSAAHEKKMSDLFEWEEIPISATTILHHFRTLSTVLTSAMYDGFIKDNPCSRVKTPKAGPHMYHYLDEKEAQLLMDVVSQKAAHPFDMIIIMLLHTGMRRGECCGLRWEDIDFDNMTINISRALLYLPGKGVFEDTPKNESSVRVIKASRSLIEMLKDYRNWQQDRAAQYGDKWENSGRVFTSAKGGNINPGTVTAWFHKFVLDNDLPYVSIHSLRHTHATILIESGVPVTTTAKRLGHSTPATTTKVYAHTIASMDARAAEFFDSILPIPKIKDIHDNVRK